MVSLPRFDQVRHDRLWRRPAETGPSRSSTSPPLRGRACDHRLEDVRIADFLGASKACASPPGGTPWSAPSCTQAPPRLGKRIVDFPRMEAGAAGSNSASMMFNSRLAEFRGKSKIPASN